MKSVAGRMKLDLAQFRELEAFAQLGTELDAATQAQLDRGYRVLEVLKQNESDPWPVEEQVAVIFAVTRGHMDKVPIADVKDFEVALLEHLRNAHAELLKGIREVKKVADESAMDKTLADFEDAFVTGRAAEVRSMA